MTEQVDDDAAVWQELSWRNQVTSRVYHYSHLCSASTSADVAAGARPSTASSGLRADCDCCSATPTDSRASSSQRALLAATAPSSLHHPDSCAQQTSSFAAACSKTRRRHGTASSSCSVRIPTAIRESWSMLLFRHSPPHWALRAWDLRWSHSRRGTRATTADFCARLSANSLA